MKPAIIAAPLALCACATAQPPAPPTELPAELPAAGAAAGARCDAAAAQALVGRTASAELGAQLLQATKARILRWVPPRTAVTMDFREDRLTVSYNDAMVIERISCG